MQYQSNQRQDNLTVLIEEYGPLVKRIAQQIKWKVPESIELDDLIQSGIIGLIEANNGFSLDHQATFKTYATLKIRYAIYEALRKHSGITRELSQSIKQVANALDNLHRENQKPTTELVSQKLGMTFHEYSCFNEEINLLKAKSLEDATESEISQDNDDNPIVDVMKSEVKEILKKIVLGLSNREQILLALYYNELLSFKEIGQVLNITEARVSQIHTQLLSKLKAHLTTGYNLIEESN
ncbi:hypothetical protein EP47_04970 [Legionella norrlandica]|uniref:RNA polymerase sigma-70 domain-containing protein n=2 Tax=Legionella norrlandica TaxID=1498499 RepID=A0A0A2T8F6_9GAMM|nr:hypothetical protein EP47_04970 [Legionella norrlandica]